MTTGHMAESGRYFVSHNGEEKGPFNLDLIEALVMSGHYPRSIMLRGEGSHDWQARFERVAAEPPTPPRAPAPSPKGSIAWIWLVSLIIVTLIGFVAIAKYHNKSARQRSGSTYTTATTAAPQQTDRPAPQPKKSWYATEEEEKRMGGKGPMHPDVVAAQQGLPEGFQWVEETPSSTTFKAQSGALPAPPTDTIVKDEQGRTYRVSHSDYSRLSQMRSGLMQEEAALMALQERVKALGGELDRAQTYLNRRSQASIDAYNRQVDRYNALNEEANQKLNRFNRGVGGFNAELARVGTPIR